MLDVLVDLCQTWALANLQVVQQGEGVDGPGESAIRGDPLVHTRTLEDQLSPLLCRGFLYLWPFLHVIHAR